ncbi:MAG: hypothetical protein Q8L48_38105 [Archangium sp.]|nr:hypothetical protein [Archangium sp.]
MHQVHWVKGFGPSRQAVLEAFAQHVEQAGHADNWFQWELAFGPAGVEVRVEAEVELPRVRLLWAAEAPWVRAAWAEVNSQFGLGGPRPIALAPVLPLEREDVTALSVEPGATPLLTSLREAIARPFPAEGALAFLHENLQARRREALAWLERHDLSGAPFLRDVAPDDWPAHLVGDPAQGRPHWLAIDMHH